MYMYQKRYNQCNEFGGVEDCASETLIFKLNLKYMYMHQL